MAERKPAKKDTRRSGRTTTEKRTSSKGFTAEERAAMKERARELKAAANEAESEKAVLAKIAEMPGPDRAMAERIHEIVKSNVYLI